MQYWFFFLLAHTDLSVFCVRSKQVYESLLEIEKIICSQSCLACVALVSIFIHEGLHKKCCPAFYNFS